MTVPIQDGTAKRLLSPSPLPSVLRPFGGAEPDALRQMLQDVAQTMIDKQFAELLGADRYARSPNRTSIRNGYRSRTLVTRIGALRLRIPRDRDALFQPAVFQRYARHEQALIGTLAECYLQGVSTRKVRKVVEALCGESVSASLVSKATKKLDATLASWRSRKLTAHAYPYLIVDAHYEKMRRESHVLSTAALWVIGIRADGIREYLGCWTGNAESTATWSTVAKDLIARGLTGVVYLVSDEHHGLKAAFQRYFPDVVQQRCQVHYLRNALAKVSTQARQQALIASLRDVWAAPTRAEAEARGVTLANALRATLPAVADWLDATLHETLACYALTDPAAFKRLRSTNALEREHEEIRRRTRVIRIFPNTAAFLRLATAMAADRNEEWSRRRYFIPTIQLEVKTPTKRRKAA